MNGLNSLASSKNRGRLWKIHNSPATSTFPSLTPTYIEVDRFRRRVLIVTASSHSVSVKEENLAAQLRETLGRIVVSEGMERCNYAWDRMAKGRLNGKQREGFISQLKICWHVHKLYLINMWYYLYDAVKSSSRRYIFIPFTVSDTSLRLGLLLCSEVFTLDPLSRDKFDSSI